MKRILALIATAILIGLLILPAGTVFADQTFHTVHAPFHSLNNYPLKNGFVVATHMNGPINFEKKEFQLHGAKPNTQFFIYRVFAEDLHRNVPPYVVPAGTPIYSGISFRTDEHGNGHIITPLAPDDPSLQAIDHTTVSLHITNLLSDGLLSAGGTRAYAAEEYETFFDW
jgi:hypothetical protein